MQNQVLRDIDLNLLVALYTLLSEKSVTQAAACLGMTQSAMSHTLRRLRDLFHDPLLVRTRKGMLPTPRGKGLIQPLRQVLSEIEQVLAPPEFDPTSTRRTFALGIPDLLHTLLLPLLLGHLSKNAPGIDLNIRTIGKNTQDDLVTGKLDLAIGSQIVNKVGFYQKKLFEERYVCVVRMDHTSIGDKISLEEFAKLNHILINRDSLQGYVDLALAKHQMVRRIALRLPTFLTAPFIVSQSDLILTAPESFAHTFSTLLSLRLLDLPLEINVFSFRQLWHERSRRDPGHVWLRNLLLELSLKLKNQFT